MKMLGALASLALKCTTGVSDSTLSALADRFSDASQRLNVALQSASERSWRTLEISLAGSSWLDQAKKLMASREEQVLRGQIQAFLQNMPLDALEKHGPSFRQACLKELQQARKAKLIPGGDLHLREAATQAQQFLRYTDPRQVISAELQAVEIMANDLLQAGYAHLGRFVALKPASGPYPLLVIAVRYFFRREVESDPRLAATWQLQQLEGLTQAQEAGFQQLNTALLEHGAKMEQLLGDVLEVVTETRDDVRAIKEELQQLRSLLAQQQPAAAPTPGLQPQQMVEMYQAVLQLLQGAPTGGGVVLPASAALANPVIPVSASPPTPSADGWAGVQHLLTRGQALSKQQQRQMPALFRAMGKLKAAAGNQQTRTRLFPNLGTPAAEAPPTESQPLTQEKTVAPPPLPEKPQDDPAKRTTAGKPRLVQIQGKPISSLFQAKKTEAEPARAEEKDKPKSPALSPLFQAAAGTSSSAPTNETTAQEPPPKSTKGLPSKLFDKNKK